MDFDLMMKKAKDVLEKNQKNDCIATALFTDIENIYVVYCNAFSHCCNKSDDDYSLNDLIKNGETRVLKMITIFKQGNIYGIELPCACLCKSLYDINNDNINVEVKMISGRIYTYLKEFSFAKL